MIRRHLEALLSTIATAQAGSIEAAKASRRHAEAALRSLNGLDERLDEQTHTSALRSPADAHACPACGRGSSEVIPAGMRPPLLRARRRDQVPDPVPVLLDADDLNAPVNSL
ncbi:MAG: hypothetical protein ABIZ72_12045 [Candidatus Limnocylindrales bacterium]